MTCKQLSVFLENRSGRLTEVLEILAKESIQVLAACVADTADYGILRIVTSDPETTYNLLKVNNVSLNRSDVFAVVIDATSSEFADFFRHFKTHGISIDYLYSVAFNGKSVLFFRPNDMERARNLIEKEKLTTLTEKEIISLE